MKKELGMGDNMYKHIYPTEASSPKFYTLPKIYKKDATL